MTRIFRGKTFEIKVNNPAGVQKGVKQVTLNGEVLEGNLVPISKMKDSNQVIVEMG